MAIPTKESLKTWLSPITTIIASITLFWTISSAIINAMNNYAQELHTNTTVLAQLQKDFATTKVDYKIDKTSIELHEKEQDAKIEALTIDIAKLLAHNRIGKFIEEPPIPEEVYGMNYDEDVLFVNNKNEKINRRTIW